MSKSINNAAKHFRTEGFTLDTDHWSWGGSSSRMSPYGTGQWPSDAVHQCPSSGSSCHCRRSYQQSGTPTWFSPYTASKKNYRSLVLHIITKTFHRKCLYLTNENKWSYFQTDLLLSLNTERISHSHLNNTRSSPRNCLLTSFDPQENRNFSYSDSYMFM